MEQYPSLTKEFITDFVMNMETPKSKNRVITIHTGEAGMEMFNFSMMFLSLDIKSSYLKCSKNYTGYTLDDINKIYYRYRSKKRQYFIATKNNKILFVSNTSFEALNFHKSYKDGAAK